MNILLFGATGMIGQGVLRECLVDSTIHKVVAVGRSPSGQHHDKLRDLVSSDLMDLTPHESQLTGFDACFFSLGVSAVGLSEEQYARVIYDLTLSVARTLLRLNAGLTFIYVSGQGADSSERGRTMWARVKGKTENALLALSPKAYMFRPGAIIPLHGIRSRTRWYNWFYTIATPLYPILKNAFPNSLTTTELVARAMIAVAAGGWAKRVLETADINAAARSGTSRSA